MAKLQLKGKKGVKQAQEELGVSTEELAELIGANVGTIRNWSSNNKLPEWAIKAIEAHIELKKAKEFKDSLKSFLD